MDVLANSPAFRTYALCVAVLALRWACRRSTPASAAGGPAGTSTRRTRRRSAGAAAAEVEHPAVAHALRIQRNDVENIPAFFASA